MILKIKNIHITALNIAISLENIDIIKLLISNDKVDINAYSISKLLFFYVIQIF